MNKTKELLIKITHEYDSRQKRWVTVKPKSVIRDSLRMFSNDRH